MRSAAVVLVLASTACSTPAPKAVVQAKPSGYPQAQHIVPLLRLNNPMLSETAELIGRAGQPQEKDLAAERLIALADVIASDRWREAQAVTVARMNRQRNSTVGDRKAQLVAWQGRHLIKVYDAMGRLGGERVFAHCTEVANDGEASAARQQAAKSVLAKHGKTKRKPAQDNYAMPIRGAAALAPRRLAPADMPTVQGAAVIDVQQVVQQLKPQFYQCYNWVVQAVGPFSAWVIINASVDKQGQVVDARSRGDVSSPPQLATCLVSVVKRARFSPLVGGDKAIVSIPLTLSPPRAVRSPTGRAPR